MSEQNIWTLEDVKAAIERAQDFPGWDRLPQPLCASINEAAWILEKVVSKREAIMSEHELHAIRRRWLFRLEKLAAILLGLYIAWRVVS